MEFTTHKKKKKLKKNKIRMKTKLKSAPSSLRDAMNANKNIYSKKKNEEEENE